MAEKFDPTMTAEAIRARREMLNHLGQREYHLPRKAMKAFMQRGSRQVWASLLKADAAPKRALYMPGKR